MSYSNPMHHPRGARRPAPPKTNPRAELQAKIARLRQKLKPKTA